MVTRQDKDTSIVARPPIGGLQTKYRSPIVVTTQTPDALNVLYDKRSVRRREGCFPVNRYLPGKNSLRNIGQKFTGREQTAPNNNVTFKVVPGYGVIGHRTYFNDYRTPGNDINFTVSFLVMPEPDGDNYHEDANWFTYNEPGANTYIYRPYLSKGPMGTNGTGTSQWTYLSGVAPNIIREGGFSIGIRRHVASGLPQWYALFNLNNGVAPTELVSDQTLRTAPRPGHVYRLTFFGATVTPGATYNYGLVISELTLDGTNSSEILQTGNVATRLLVNRGPILLFDMPAALLEPPNLDNGLNGANGTYLTSVLRGEGRIEDISWWNVDKTTNLSDLTFARTFEILNPVGQTGLIAYWRPGTPSERKDNATGGLEDGNWCPEGTGKDAPVFLCPDVPKWNRATSFATSLYFDGRTSYAFLQSGINSPFANPPVGGQSNNNLVASASANSFEQLVVTGVTPSAGPATKQHSIQITFIPDTIEARADDGTGGGAGVEIEAQCLMWWHGVVKIGISSRGNLYCGAAIAGPAFSATSFGTTNLIPGQKYTVLYERLVDADARVYLNGEQEIGPIALGSGPGAVADGMPGFILGMEDQYAAGVSTRRTYPRNTDYTKTFLGRIEDVRVAGGLLPTTLWNVPLTDQTLYVDAVRPWAVDDNSTDLTANGPSSSAAPPASVHQYWFHTPYYTNFSKPPFFSDNTKKVLLIDGPGTAPNTQLAVAANPPSPPTGVDANNVQHLRISQYLAWWTFKDPAILSNALESRYRPNREYADATRHVFQQEFSVPDELGFFWPMNLMSVQPERLAGLWGANPGFFVFPWLQMTPKELKPRMARGMVPSLAQTNPITLITQLKKADGNKFSIAAAATSLYWLQPPWYRLSPYAQEQDANQYSFFGAGRLGQHIQIRSNSDWAMSSNSTDRTFEFWLYVPELGERREIAMSWSGGATQAYNWRIMLAENGGIYVEGWANAAYWRIGTQVTPAGAPTQFGPIQPGRWQFVAITLDADTTANDRVWVDGVVQPMDAAVGNHNTNWAEATSVAKWIAGHPAWFLAPAINPTGGGAVPDQAWLPLFGFLRDFRVSSGQRYAFGTQTAFAVPTSPLSADGTTITLLPLNDGADLVASASGTGVYKGTIRSEEMLPILDGSLIGSNSSERYPYSSAQYGDVLYVSNGLGPPLAVRHDGVLRSQRGILPSRRGPLRPFGFYIGRDGMTPPGEDPPSLVGQDSGTGPSAARPFEASNGATLKSVQLAVTFVDINGLESDPVFYELNTPDAGGAAAWARIKLVGVPRSYEPHVVARQIYVGSTAGANAKLFDSVQFTDDNTTDEVEISQSPGNGKDLEFTNGPPPITRYIAVFRGRKYHLADTADLYFSEALKPESVSNSTTAINILKLEAGAGGIGTFVREHLGQLYAGTRRGVFLVQPGDDTVNFVVTPITSSRGFISNGSLHAFDNDMIGAMEKGVHAFNGSGLEYFGEDLEGLWSQPLDPSTTTIDLSPAGALTMHGAYFDQRNQYWLTVRRKGERFGREMLVYDRVVTDPQTGRHPWSLVKTIQHSFLTVIEDSFDGKFRLFVGTPEGQVMEMLPELFAGSTQAFNDIDGNRQLVDPNVASGGYVMQGLVFSAATPGSTTTMVPVLLGAGQPTLDVLGHGMRGLWMIIAFTHPLHSAQYFGQTFEVRITRNVDTSITFDPPLPEPVHLADGFGFDSFIIGAYWAYQTTPWMSAGTIANVKQMMGLDFDFAPNPLTTLDVRWLMSNGGRNLDEVFDYNGVPQEQRFPLSQTDGYHNENVRVGPRGLYARHFFGTRGINVPFEVFGWDMALNVEGNRKGLQ